MRRKPAKSRKQAAEESRERLLQAGLELLGSELGSPFDNIRSTEVARAAGYTPGAFYHHWPSQDDYREDLRAYVGGQVEVGESLDRLASDMFAEAENGLAAALQATCRREVEIQVSSPSWHIQLAMLGSQVQADLDKSALQYELWFEGHADFYAGVLEALDLELIPGVTMEWFTRTMAALNEGFSLQVRSGMDADIEGIEEDWQAYSLAVGVLISSVVRRRDGVPVTAETVAGKLAELTA